MKRFQLFILLAIITMAAFPSFAQETPDAMTTFLKWKAENVINGDKESYQGAGFSVTKLDKGVVAKFYVEYGPDVTGLHATEFIAQPVKVTRTRDGKTDVADIGKPLSLRSEGMMLVKGETEDRVATPQITFLMPDGADAVRLTVKKMFGEDGSSEIILGVNASGTVSRLK
jgi:hypothetical protein